MCRVLQRVSVSKVLPLEDEWMEQSGYNTAFMCVRNHPPFSALPLVLVDVLIKTPLLLQGAPCWA